MTEQPEPGGVNWTTRQFVTGGEVRVEPPAEIAVKALGAIDVRDRDDDDLELHVDRPRSRALDCSIAAHLSTGHVKLLRFECLEPSLPVVRLTFSGTP